MDASGHDSKSKVEAFDLKRFAKDAASAGQDFNKAFSSHLDERMSELGGGKNLYEEAFRSVSATVVAKLNDGVGVGVLHKALVDIAGKFPLKIFNDEIAKLLSDPKSGVSKSAKERLIKRSEVAKQAAEKRKADAEARLLKKEAAKKRAAAKKSAATEKAK